MQKARVEATVVKNPNEIDGFAADKELISSYIQENNEKITIPLIASYKKKPVSFQAPSKDTLIEYRIYLIGYLYAHVLPFS